jgi:hypothetical protein
VEELRKNGFPEAETEPDANTSPEKVHNVLALVIVPNPALFFNVSTLISDGILINS